MTHGERRSRLGRIQLPRRESLSTGPWRAESAERVLRARGWRLSFEPTEGRHTVIYLPPEDDNDQAPYGIDRSQPIRINDPVFFFLHRRLKISKRTLRRELDDHHG
jgi:hypothetical protein